jgi:hypothetical protein
LPVEGNKDLAQVEDDGLNLVFFLHVSGHDLDESNFPV